MLRRVYHGGVDADARACSMEVMTLLRWTWECVRDYRL
jgi:hypothetical protein